MKQFILGVLVGLVFGSGITYAIVDHYWPKIKIEVKSGNTIPFYKHGGI